jgi:hypothetical protein
MAHRRQLAGSPFAGASLFTMTPTQSEFPETGTVPQGVLTTHTLAPGQVYPGVTHAYQVYVPAQ